ncbi:hypothetical protein BCF33_0718 [Hasllibacter halocynthiae]|uniref:Uncharacterized protein n=1 Tax=Hasllibacter halocynthiae TaxID=595589 RepID=A0A2T0X879_9RHOB|nr:hypothetical protein BCF33_0718 [Hasllibacter halocynthiae]
MQDFLAILSYQPRAALRDAVALAGLTGALFAALHAPLL